MMRPWRVVLVLAAVAVVSCKDDNPGPPSADAAADIIDDIDVTGDISEVSDMADISSDIADTSDAGSDAETPAFVSTPPVWVEAGTRYEYTIEMEPSGGGRVVLLDGPEDAVMVEWGFDRWTLQWDAPAEGVGAVTFDLGLYVQDAQVDGQTFDVTVDRPPLLRNTPDPIAYVGELWTFAPAPIDPDGDPVTLQLAGDPSWLTLTGEGEDVLLEGTPTDAGETTVELVATAGALERRFAYTVTTVVPVENVTANVGYVTSYNATVRLTGCCFTDAMDVHWGAIPATEVTRESGSALNVVFDYLPTGQQQLVVSSGGIPLGASARPLLSVPHVGSALGFLTVRGTFEDTAQVQVIDILTEASLVATHYTQENGLVIEIPISSGAVIQVGVDGVFSAPFKWFSPPEPIALHADPALHAPGSQVVITFARPIVDSIVAQWGDTSRDCVPLEDTTTCTVRAPLDATGPLTLRTDVGPVPLVRSAAIDTVPIAPAIDFASQRTLRLHVPTVIRLGGIGLDTAGATVVSTDGTATILHTAADEAVISFTATGLDASVAWRAGGTNSAVVPFDVVP